MSKQIDVRVAKTQLSRLVEDAARGQEIIITKNGEPLARMVALAKPARIKKRRLGVSNHHLMEVEPREIADAEIEKLFEDSRLWPDQ